jgi:hypothetical protein
MELDERPTETYTDIQVRVGGLEEVLVEAIVPLLYLKVIYNATILMNMNNGEKKLLAVISGFIIITVVVVVFNALQQDILLGHVTGFGLHMPLAILHVREQGVKSGTELIFCLLKQPFICCLSLFRKPTKDQFVTQWFPSFTEFGPKILGCSLAPARD